MMSARLALPVPLLALCLCTFADDKGKAPTPPANPGLSATGMADDISQVKRIIAARQEYQSALEDLRAHYIRQGDMEHVRWVEEELLAYHRISKRAYRLELDVPPPTLTPSQNLPEANDLFRRAVAFMSRGWGQESDDNYRRAEILFQQILSLYPQSD